MKRIACAFLLLFSPLLRATYTYYATDNLENRNNSAPNWNINGTSTNSSSGLTVTAATGASYIAKAPPPDATNQYEVAATLHLPASGGTYVLYLEASPNALLGSTSAGSFYAFAIKNPTFSGSACTASATLYKVVNGTVSQISSTTVPCSNGVVYHAVLGNDQALRLWVNGIEYLSWTDSSPLSGKGGIGGYGIPANNAISLAQLGPCDRIAPAAVAQDTLQNYALSNEVDLQSAGSDDDANGSGVSAYLWSRDGAQVATTQTPNWSDPGASPGVRHGYSIQARDHHGNLSTATAFGIPVPTTSFDPRQLGRRPTGSYWGALGEQIDLRSGNLNFSYPLIKAISRGWSIPLQLVYNSQTWFLDDTGSPWRLGQDVGFGYGWTLQIGSLTPFYSSYFNVKFYQFTDASGATYRLDQNSGGVC